MRGKLYGASSAAFLVPEDLVILGVCFTSIQNCDCMSSSPCYKNNKNVVCTDVVSGIVEVTALTRTFSSLFVLLEATGS